jgi:tetratricopeptide (TPR) repeat protein
VTTVNRTTVLSLVAFVATLVSVGSASLASRSGAGAPTGSALADADEVKGPLTTGGTIAMRNLESDLLDAEARVAEDPTSIRAQLRRSNLVYLRARVTGDIDEMARALTMTDACVRENRASAEARLLRAVQLQTLHRFDEARTDLRIARELGGDPQKIAVLERELDWNAGLAGPAAKAIREEAASQPTVASLSRAARLAHDLGQHDAADALYGSALAKIESKDPIPVAMLEVQRGTNLADAGRLVEAAETFRNAAARLPKYTAAREHLAKALHRLGRDDQARALYEEITRSSTDPEFVGALAALYRQQGRVAEADGLRARATKRYEELIRRYPEAMAFHAAEFFAGEGGDATRAWTLLQKNAAIRPNAESLEALGRLERAAGDRDGADELTRRAGVMIASAQPAAATPTR